MVEEKLIDRTSRIDGPLLKHTTRHSFEAAVFYTPLAISSRTTAQEFPILSPRVAVVFDRAAVQAMIDGWLRWGAHPWIPAHLPK